MRSESYKGQQTTHKVKLSKMKYEKLIRGRDIVVVEDIIDTGWTINEIVNFFIKKGAKSVSVAALISKPHRREIPFEADYTGFTLQIDNEDPDPYHLWTWVEGYGLDTNGINRDHPDVVIGHERDMPKVYKGPMSVLAESFLALAKRGLQRAEQTVNVFHQN
jgi:hypoxanthine phosphoribosyltransferase